MNSNKQTHQEWKKEYKKLEDDLDKFRNYFDKNKKCKCDVDNCRHFDRALANVLGERIDKMFQSRLDIGLRTFYDLTRQS